MRNNRSVILPKDGADEVPPPPKDSLFWLLWNECEQIATDTLATPFIQGIKDGNLDPVIYGAFNISDAYYCFEGADAYAVACQRATDPDLEQFLKLKYQSYVTYNEVFPKCWRVKSQSVIPSKVCFEYSSFETKVAKEADPIYTLIVMIPCDYLWVWLAQQIKLQPIIPGNVYEAWITDNGSDEALQSCYKMGNYLEKYQESHPIDFFRAIDIYKTAMQFEHDNFKDAFPNKRCL